jgi:hypothetical protein
VTKKAIHSPDLVTMSRSGYAVFRHFDFGHSAKREQQFDQIFRRILGSLSQDMADSSGYGRVKKNTSGL